jgi:hypothetical protein
VNAERIGSPARGRRLGSARTVVVFFAALLSSCASTNATRNSPGYGTVIGSIEVVLARPKRSMLDGFFEENLSVRTINYTFEVGRADRSWTDSPTVVSTKGKPHAFAMSLKPGAYVVENLELRRGETSGLGRLFLRVMSPVDGRDFALNLEFPVVRDRITYIGRIRVVLPTNLKLFSSQYKLTVEDRELEDYAAMASLIESVPLPIEKSLATRIK